MPVDLTTIDDATLIARGKLSTLNRTARIRRLEIRDHMSTVVDQARVVVRTLDTETDPAESIVNIIKTATAALAAYKEILELLPSIEELKPVAWSKGKSK